MPSVQYGISAYKRGEFPELKLINLFVEKSMTSENQIALLSRPGLATSFTAGSGTIAGVFAKQGTLGGDVFSISGSTLYRQTTSLGAVSGTGAASFAGGFGELCVTRGATLYSYNGTNLADSTFAGNASNNVSSVVFLNSSFFAAEADSGRIYWSDPLDGRTWDALHFVTAERSPDNILDMAVLGNNLWAFGEESTEVFADTGDADARLVPIETIGYNKGIYATGCVTHADNSLFMVGSDRVVYRIGEAPQRVSDHGIEERIGDSTTAALFSFQYQGHEFVCLRLDTETFAYDCATLEWCEFQSSQGQWIVRSSCMADGIAYFGGSSGRVMVFSGWDDLGDALERRFTFAQQLDQPLSVNSIRIWANVGRTPVLTGQGSDPQIELRTSDDGGNTFGAWEAEDLGVEGEYTAVPEWRALGMFAFPGIVGEARVTDPVPLRISAVKFNDPGGGRG